VARLLPGVVTGTGNDGRRITVRQLLQHTSGLYDYTHDLIPTIDTPAEYARNRDRISPPAPAGSTPTRTTCSPAC
jgi:CubicO group peptidase (beta-lactamase class C family)